MEYELGLVDNACMSAKGDCPFLLSISFWVSARSACFAAEMLMQRWLSKKSVFDTF